MATTLWFSANVTAIRPLEAIETNGKVVLLSVTQNNDDNNDDTKGSIFRWLQIAHRIQPSASLRMGRAEW